MQTFINKDGMFINPHYLSLMEELGFISFDAVMEYAGGTCLSRKKFTSVLRMYARSGQVLFLKRHRSNPLRQFAEALIQFCKRSAWRRFLNSRRTAFREFLNILELSSIGIETATPVAAGQRRRGTSIESFLLTLELKGALDATFYVHSFYDPVETNTLHLKWTILKEAAHILRRLHQNRFYHQDLHVRHFFVEPNAQKHPKLYLIDLHAAGRCWFLPFGFLLKIKDLAWLYEDCCKLGVSGSDRLRFYKAYTGRQRLDWKDRWIFRLVRLFANWRGRIMRAKSKESKSLRAQDSKSQDSKTQDSKTAEKRYEEIKERYQDEREVATYDATRFQTLRGRIHNRQLLRALRRALEKLKQMGEPHPSVLDIPCGTGRLFKTLSSNNTGFIGADISFQMMQVAKTKLPATKNFALLPLVCCDAERIPFKDRSFDAVISVRFFTLIPAAFHAKLLREMARVSRDWVIIEVRHKLSILYFMRWLVKKLYGRPWKLRYFSLRELREELEEAGIELAEVFRVGWPLWDKCLVMGRRVSFQRERYD